METVQTKYPEMIQSFSGDCSPGETLYECTKGNVSRYFRFYNNKLYWVRVVYEDLNQTEFDSMLDKIRSIYGGEWINYDVFGYTNDSRVKFGYALIDVNNLNKDTWLTVEVHNIFNGFGVKLGEDVFTTYSSISIEEELKKQATENFEL